jgi:hypothetical protein
MPTEEKPSRNEDEYFAKVNADLLKTQRAKLDEERAKTEREARKQTHYMKCPKDGGDLKEESFQQVKIDRCTECGGVWLDAGELDMMSHVDQGRRSGFFGSLFKLPTR